MLVFSLVFLAFIVNFAIYKSIDTLIDDIGIIPKWIKLILLLVPPMSLIVLLLISICTILLAVYDTIKNI